MPDSRSLFAHVIGDKIDGQNGAGHRQPCHEPRKRNEGAAEAAPSLFTLI